ncbi:hypothetical protein TNCV_3493461 [Trichonephila clavipes]|nr:hypothetical protein TNCV_3493461 [Trichonephila clavipes]
MLHQVGLTTLMRQVSLTTLMRQVSLTTLMRQWVDKMDTKLAWELNTGDSRLTDQLTGASAHAPQCPRS